MNSRGLTASQIKGVAILTMLLDHIAWLFIPRESVPGFFMHLVGRITAPTMCFFSCGGILPYQEPPTVCRSSCRVCSGFLSALCSFFYRPLSCIRRRVEFQYPLNAFAWPRCAVCLGEDRTDRPAAGTAGSLVPFCDLGGLVLLCDFIYIFFLFWAWGFCKAGCLLFFCRGNLDNGKHPGLFFIRTG